MILGSSRSLKHKAVISKAVYWPWSRYLSRFAEQGSFIPEKRSHEPLWPELKFPDSYSFIISALLCFSEGGKKQVKAQQRASVKAAVFIRIPALISWGGGGDTDG